MALKFNNHTIENDNIKITTLDYYSMPKKEVDLFQLAYANRSTVPYTEYPNKTIRIEGILTCDNNTSLDELIDTFNSYFIAKEANLDIDHNGSVRRFIATVNAQEVNRTMSLRSASFAIEFICSEPFGLDTSLTTASSVTGRTTASYTATPTIGGTAPLQLPIITITINSLTGTGDYIQVSNNANNQSILIYGQGLANGDVVVINCDERTVTVDGVDVEYLGAFLELEPGNASISYADGFTTRNVDIKIEYYKRYI